MDGEQILNSNFKRYVAYKFRIGSILAGRPVFDADKLKHIEINGQEVARINLIANIVDKFVQDGEKKYGTVTLDDATGQIRAKFFGEDIERLGDLNQGDTVLVVGLLRMWNNEIYITPEIMRKKETAFLLVRKLELESEQPQSLNKEKIAELKDKILQMVKDAESTGGVEIDKIILELKEPPDVINNEIKRLLEDGIAYEPRPGKLRYLG